MGKRTDQSETDRKFDELRQVVSWLAEGGIELGEIAETVEAEYNNGLEEDERDTFLDPVLKSA